jgi:hypothetical protein
MASLSLADISDLRAYERERPEYLRHVMEIKAKRRVSVGPIVTFVFENRATVRLQIQEMARVEQLISDDAIQTELDIYNSLIPEPGTLSATMIVELTSDGAGATGCRVWSGSSGPRSSSCRAATGSAVSPRASTRRNSPTTASRRASTTCASCSRPARWTPWPPGRPPSRSTTPPTTSGRSWGPRRCPSCSATCGADGLNLTSTLRRH